MKKHQEELSTPDFVAVAGNEKREEIRHDEPPSRGGAKMVREEPPAALFAPDEADRMRARWNEIQAAFVDEPRKAVEKANELVADAMKRLTEIFSSERSNLEHQWDRGSDVSTEDLRLALQRYRSFFNRLLSV